MTTYDEFNAEQIGENFDPAATEAFIRQSLGGFYTFFSDIFGPNSFETLAATSHVARLGVSRMRAIQKAQDRQLLKLRDMQQKGEQDHPGEVNVLQMNSTVDFIQRLGKMRDTLEMVDMICRDEYERLTGEQLYIPDAIGPGVSKKATTAKVNATLDHFAARLVELDKLSD